MATNIKLSRTKFSLVSIRLVLVLFSGLLLVLFSGLPSEAKGAEQKLTLSVTPPLFQLNIGPGEFWASSLKVVNTNPYDLTLYASVMNFKASGEEGYGKLTPIVEEDPEVSGHTLARWIEVSKEPIFVPREKSADVPFLVRIPDDAPPGGHYAAILVGTHPLDDSTEGSVIRVSSLVSSLLFVRIKGDIREEGMIREFSTEKTFYQKPDVAFTLRFRNTGNVHLQPQGDIVIYNMWGKERGRITVNQKTAFGNVLPQSVRKFIFTWQGEEDFFEVGRYKAVATLSFGEEARQNVFRTTYFWVVPLKPTLGIIGGFVVFMLIMSWGIRVYVRRALALAREGSVGAYGTGPSPARPVHPAERDKLGEAGEQVRYGVNKIRTWTRPMVEGVIDLRNIAKQVQNSPRPGFGRRDYLYHKAGAGSLFRVGLAVLKSYYTFIIFMIALIGGMTGLVVYFGETLIPERSFDVVIQREGKETINISSEEIIKEKLITETDGEIQDRARLGGDVHEKTAE